MLRPVHKATALNGILPRLMGFKYLTLINVSLGYHNLKLDKIVIIFNNIFLPFGRYRYILPCIAAQAGDLFSEE